jgi:predicted Zn finger-like uncharacterized protein
VYTQCPECNAVYRVTSAHLRPAGGEVRCGECGVRFDALDHLSDTYPKKAAAAPASERAERDSAETATADAGIAENQEPEVEAGAGPDSGGVPEPGAADGRELVENEARSGSSDVPEEAVAPEQEDPGDEQIRQETGMVADEGTDDEPTIDLDMTSEEIFSLREFQDQELPPVGDLEFVEGLPPTDGEASQSTESAPPIELMQNLSSIPWHRFRRFVVPSVIVLLVVMTIHSQRGTLMRNSTVAPALGRIYEAIGLTVEPAWDVSAYRIIDSAATVDAKGDLQVSVRFANDAEFAQPFPALRVSLEDRWGDEFGIRELTPEEYMGASASDRMLGPGRRAEGQATIESPDLAAVGFRLDLCLPSAGGELRCLSNQP